MCLPFVIVMYESLNYTQCEKMDLKSDSHCVAAITVNLSLEAGQSIGKNDLIVKFLKGAWRLNPPRPQTVPSWDLSIVLLLRVLLYEGSMSDPLSAAWFGRFLDLIS